MTTDPEEVMDSLKGRSITDWGRDDTMYHVVLDDGRVLIFMGLGIVIPGEYALH
jgi:hypothetical protein